MHPKVTPAILEQYEEEGVAHVPGAFSADWIVEMADAIDTIVAGLRSGDMAYGPHEYAGNVEFEDHDGYTRLINVYWRSPEIQDLVLRSDGCEIVADVIGSDEMRPWVDGTFIKEGDAPETATPWHNDECTFPLTGSHSPSMWVALTDVPRENAPLRTLKGSHRDKHRYFSTFAVLESEPPEIFHPWSELTERVNAPDADISVWEAKAGDMLIIHPKTIHSSLPRTATQAGRRAAFSLRWLGSDIRYEHNPTTKDYPYESHPGIAEGEPLPADLFPAVWRRA